MKKIFFLLVILLVSISTITVAQNATGKINVGDSYITMSFSDADTINANQDEYIIQFNAAQHFPTTQDFKLVVDSLDAPNISVQFAGSKFGDSYTNIEDAVTWTGTTSDTTIVISNTTANRYRFYRATITSNSGEAQLSETALKLFYE